jgi:hypothetical protein
MGHNFTTKSVGKESESFSHFYLTLHGKPVKKYSSTNMT